jgi:hypothetical protein
LKGGFPGRDQSAISGLLRHKELPGEKPRVGEFAETRSLGVLFDDSRKRLLLRQKLMAIPNQKANIVRVLSTIECNFLRAGSIVNR